jgi:hypothetical protein
MTEPPSAEELAAVLAALSLRAAREVPSAAAEGAVGRRSDDPLSRWRRRRLAVLGQAPRRTGSHDPR